MEPQHIVSIDEIKLHSRKIVNVKAGEGSSSHDRPATTREERIKTLMGARAQMKVVKEAKIQNVIFWLRDHKDFVKYFEPKVVSLGPIHHGKPRYQLGEKYKLILASDFIQDCSGNDENSYEDINCLYEKVKKKIKTLRECFEEKVTTEYDDESLAWMLFVDGCAILQYIFRAENDKFKELNIKSDSVTFAQQDLFLLENQVPYRLLKLLIRWSGKDAQFSELIESYIRNVSYLQREKQKPEEKDPTHLLDLLRTRLLGPSQFLGKTRRWPCGKILHGEGPQDWQSYRNVQELRAAGIQLKRGDSNYLRNISFTRLFNFYPGFLLLPPITVDDSTGPKFMNLIAYERCLDFDNDFGISSYISFLDSLIDEPNDVKDLRKAQVLHNFLGSDKHVADLFNEIGTDLVPNNETYMDVKFQIQCYYENNCMTWMAQFFHDRFGAPWTVLAFLGVLLGLALTAIQTWYAVQ
jgi:hypothetical protein